MEIVETRQSNQLYQRAIVASKRVRWTIADVIRNRSLAGDYKFMPDGLSFAQSLDFLNESDRRLVSRIQGRTYANVFGLVERYINTMVLELVHNLGPGRDLEEEALLRFSEEEIKHQELFRIVEGLCAESMPPGYRFTASPAEVAAAVLSKSTWAVLALTCHIELFTLAHYKHSIEPDSALSPLWKDVFLHHFKEESQHAMLDELQWLKEDARVNASQRNHGVDDFIVLVSAVDGILQQQAEADAGYLVTVLTRALTADQTAAIRALFLKAYRYQFIMSGVHMTRFPEILFGMITSEQRTRIEGALASFA